MRLAAMDLGSNSFHLVVVEKDGRAQAPTVLRREREMVRLGEGTLVRGSIPPERLSRARAAVERLHAAAQEMSPDLTVAVATSAMREASNRDDLLNVAEALGLHIRVLTGDEEAALVFVGARAWLGPQPARLAVFDMGGGSLEVAVGQAHCMFTASLPLGVLRMTQLHPLTWPAAPDALGPIAERARVELDPVVAQARRIGFDAIALTSGTALTLGALRAAKPRFVPRALERTWLHQVIHRLAGETPEERERRPGMDGRRADIIAHGAVVLGAVMDACQAEEALLCPSALREGLVLQTLEEHCA